MSIEPHLALYVASYSDPDAAQQDFDALKAAEGSDLSVEGAIIMSRDADGDVDVLAKETGITGGGAVLGGGVGLVVGLFAPPLLASTAIGAGIGAVLGHLTKRHEEKELGVELDAYLPPDSSAVVVVVDNRYLDRVEHALIRAQKRVDKAISKDDYDKLVKALEKSDEEIGDALDS